MKTHFIYSLLFVHGILLLVTNMYAQSTDEILKQIRTKYAAINDSLGNFYSNQTATEQFFDTDGPYEKTITTTTKYYKTKNIVEYTLTEAVGGNRFDSERSSADIKKYTFYNHNSIICEFEREFNEGHPPYNLIKETYYKDEIPFYYREFKTENNVDLPGFNNENEFMGEVIENDGKGGKITKSANITAEIARINEICARLFNDKDKYYRETDEYRKKEMTEESKESSVWSKEFTETATYCSDLQLINIDVNHEGLVNGFFKNASTTQFYFSNDLLFFYFIQGYTKEPDNEGDGSKYLNNAFEKRIYVNNKVPVRILEKKQTDKSDDINETDEGTLLNNLSEIANKQIDIAPQNYTEIKVYLK